MKTRTISTKTRRKEAARKHPKLPPVKIYSNEEVAGYLLTNTLDAEDYARACKLVRKMGLDPSHIDHDKPVGVK